MKYVRPLDCPCIKREKPACREGANCWHFGNNRGTCDHCHNTGYVIPEKARPSQGKRDE